jgi:hypothetical protein
VEENIQLNLFLKQKPPKCTSYGRKHPVVLLMTENTQLYLLWKKTPSCSPNQITL